MDETQFGIDGFEATTTRESAPCAVGVSDKIRSGKMNYGQQLRPESERNLSQWELDALDLCREKAAQEIREHPAIWRKLVEIEAKLDQLIAMRD